MDITQLKDFTGVKNSLVRFIYSKKSSFQILCCLVHFIHQIHFFSLTKEGHNYIKYIQELGENFYKIAFFSYKRLFSNTYRVVCQWFSSWEPKNKQYFQPYIRSVNPNWHEGGHFPHPCLFWILVCQLSFFIKNFQFVLEVKIDINRVNLTPCHAH